MDQSVNAKESDLATNLITHLKDKLNHLSTKKGLPYQLSFSTEAFQSSSIPTNKAEVDDFLLKNIDNKQGYYHLFLLHRDNGPTSGVLGQYRHGWIEADFNSIDGMQCTLNTFIFC